MTIDSLGTWKSTFKDKVKPVGDSTWPDNLTNWYEELFKSPKLSLPGITLAVSPLPVTFGVSAFKAIYSQVHNKMTAAEFGEKIADAWEAGLLAGSVQVKAGDSIGVPSPATTFSLVTSCVFTPASITAGKAKVFELASITPVTNNDNVVLPQILREATLLLKVTTIGLNSVPPPTGAQPLNDVERSVA